MIINRLLLDYPVLYPFCIRDNYESAAVIGLSAKRVWRIQMNGGGRLKGCPVSLPPVNTMKFKLLLLAIGLLGFLVGLVIPNLYL